MAGEDKENPHDTAIETLCSEAWKAIEAERRKRARRYGHKRYIGDVEALRGRGALVRPGPADNIVLAQFDFSEGHRGGKGDEDQDPRCFGWHEVPIEDFEEFPS